MSLPTGPLGSLTRLVGALRRRVLLHRRWLAALLTGLAVLLSLRATQAPPPQTETAWTAARDLAVGQVLAARDLQPREYVPGTLPDGAIRDPAAVTGRVVAAPVRAGEPLTDVRLLGRGLLGRLSGLTATPVRIGDPGMVSLLRPGDLVDVVATDPQGQEPTRVLAHRVRVLLIPPAPRSDLGVDPAAASGGLVVLAIPDSSAPEVSGAAVRMFLTVLLTR